MISTSNVMLTNQLVSILTFGQGYVTNLRLLFTFAFGIVIIGT